MGPGTLKPARRRNRKRKRRIASETSTSEEDSSSDSESSDASTPDQIVTVQKSEKPTTPDTEDSEEGSSSSDESRDDSDAGVERLDKSLPLTKLGCLEPHPQRDSPSPQPIADILPFVPPNTLENEQILKEKFRKFWMTSIAEGFKDDLEEIRKEPNLGASRLALLIDSLASGADVFSSSSIGGSVNEMEVVLDQLP